MLQLGGRLDHVGIVVDDLEEAVMFLRDVLGLQQGDRVDRANLRAVFFSAGSIEVEAIEIIDPDERALRLGDGVAARLDHVAIEVSDLDRVLALLAARGVRTKAPPQQAERYRMCWTAPESTDGVAYQLVERSAARDAHVFRAADVESVDRGRGVSTVHLCTAERGARSIANGITTIEPGSEVPFHFHDCEESVLILEGRAVFDLEDSAQPMDEGDVTYVPAGVSHRFRNVGSGPLRLFFTYGSATATRTSVATGETARIGSGRDRLEL